MAASTDDELGPGLHVLRESDPLQRAGTMAAQLRAQLCATVEQVDAVLAERATLPALDRPALGELQLLARRVGRAHRIAERTRQRAVADAGVRLSTATGLAVHPDTVRERAAAVDRARAELAAAERAAAEHEAALATEDADPAEDELPAPTSPVARAESALGLRRSRAIGVLVASFGAALVCLAIGILPLWAALIIPLVAALWALRYLRPDEDDEEYDRESSDLLAEVGAAAERLFGAHRAEREQEARTASLGLRRSRAEEELRVAERAWRDLAGEGVDASEVESVVRRFDPQREDARLLADASTSVRAADVVLHQLAQRWQRAWQAVGADAPLPADAERAVDSLAAQLSRPVVLIGPAADRGAALARVALAAPIVVLDGPLEAGAVS